MFAYVDFYMRNKPKGLRYVVLNVYGGESLHHPDIVEILRACHDKYKKYQDQWHLTITTTTNAVINDRRMSKIIPYIDEFTVSYHSENTDKQKKIFTNNVLKIKDANKRLKCIIMMHSDPKKFLDSQHMITWCRNNDIKFLPKQIDHRISNIQFNYSKPQVKWFQTIYNNKSYQTETNFKIKSYEGKIDLADTGRACCGGRQTCQDQNYKQRHFFVENKFPDWYCSVNEFFLHVKQVNGEIFVNKDCKMDFAGNVAPIGNLKNTNKLLEKIMHDFDTDNMPVIQCKKSSCSCGLCAPKAKNLNTFDLIMKKYRI